jgi:sigma-B regulation protein RsbU (phosphoserine phosphatase)
LDKDIEGAKEVRNAFFPQETLSIPSGGDFYDFLSLRADHWGIAIGDVCGQGIGAALLMANLLASLQARAMHTYSDLSTLIGDVDRLFRAASPKHLYTSLFCAEYDAATRVLRYVNAGHNAPMVLRWKQSQCEVFHLKSSGPALGILEFSIHLQSLSTRKR